MSDVVTEPTGETAPQALPEVVIVSYRRADLLAQCLDSVERHLPGTRVHVWDNHSEGSADVRELASTRPHVSWTFCDDNVGFARAVNGLMREVEGPTAFLLNPDAVLLGDLAGCRRALAEDPQVAAAGPNVEEAGHRPWDNAHREPTWIRHLVSYSGYTEAVNRFAPVSLAYRDRPLEVDGYITGAGLLISMAAWRSVGEFDERYFLYGEEADWCHRARKRGLRLVSVDEPGIRHTAAGTVSDEKGAVTRSDILLAQSRVRYIRDQQGLLAATAFRVGAGALELLQRSKRDIRPVMKAAALGDEETQPRWSFIVTTPTLGVGGAERQRVALVNGLAEAGETVQLRALQAFGPLAADVSDDVTCRLAPYTSATREAARETVLVTGTSRIEIAFGIAWRALNVPHGRWVIANHQPPEESGPVFARVTATAMLGADGMIYLSESHRREHKRYQRLDRGRYWVVPNGVDLRDVDAPSFEKSSEGEPLRLVTASRLAEVKKLDLLVRALSEGLGDVAWTLDIHGEGPAREKIEAAVGAAGEVAKRIRLRGWCADVPAMLREADVLCLPSRAEAQPMTILEAMAVGTSVAAHPVAAVPEMLADGAAGYLVTPPTEESWRMVVRELAANPAERTRRARVAYDRVRDAYSLEAMIRGYRQVRSELTG